MAETPTAATIRASSQVDFGSLGFPDGGDPDPLQAPVDQATSYITWVTGRTWDNPLPMDPMTVPIMDQAAQMRTEQIVYQDSADNVETAGDYDMIQSFTAGSYSETRRELEKPPRMLNPWPALDRLLWLLLSQTPAEIAAGGNGPVQDRFDYWRWVLGMAPVPPAWETIEVDWAEGLGQGGDLYLGFGSDGAQWPVVPMAFPPGY